MPVATMWYARDRRLTTQAARRAAIETARAIRCDDEMGAPTSTRDLFVALHTCAYWANRTRGQNAPSTRERAQWFSRWEQIREFLVEQNLGLAYSMIHRFRSLKIDEHDVLSEALLGLTKAVDRFDPWKGYRFSTYACNVIARALMRRGRREHRLRGMFPVQHDESYEKPSPGRDFQTELYVERLNRALDHNLGDLTDLESRVLAERFPEDNGRRSTFKEIGDMVGLSKERIRQIQNEALIKLRFVLTNDPVLQ